jgi:hypothetical protein
MKPWPCLGGELRRMHIRHPDLDRPHPLGPQAVKSHSFQLPAQRIAHDVAAGAIGGRKDFRHYSVPTCMVELISRRL